MSEETPKKSKRKSQYRTSGAGSSFEALAHIRYDPNNKTLQFRTPFTAEHGKRSVRGHFQSVREYRLTDERLEPFLKGFERDKSVDWNKLRGSIKKKIKCDDATAKQIALYAFLHSPIHAPVLSAVNAINNFYLTPFEQWATSTTNRVLDEMPKDVLIERSYEHFTEDGNNKCMDHWVYNNKQRHFCEGKAGPKRKQGKKTPVPGCST